MKFNWGTGLTIFFIIFVSTLVFVLYQAFQQDNSLVMDNYYEEDIKYQQQYDKIKNTSELTTKVKLDFDSAKGEISLTFPLDSMAITTGIVLVYHPADKSADKKYDFNLNQTNVYQIKLDKMTKGRIKVKIDWERAGVKYYQEEEIII
jgi:hypothetical protein